LPLTAWGYLHTGSVVFIASNMVAAAKPRNPAGPLRLNRTLRLYPQFDVSRSF
jgi:hypothetical protein